MTGPDGAAGGHPAVQRDPENPSMHYRYYTLLAYIRKEVHERGDNLLNDPYIARMEEQINKARSLATKDHPQFVEIHIAAHQFVLGKERDRERADRRVPFSQAVPGGVRDAFDRLFRRRLITSL